MNLVAGLPLSPQVTACSTAVLAADITFVLDARAVGVLRSSSSVNLAVLFV
jgi:hypothetical protein